MNPTRPLHTMAVALLLFTAVTGGLGALEIDSGSVRLVLHEGSGRYSLYVRSASDPAKYVALFVDRDPRTSWLSLVVDGRIHRLGEGGAFRETAAVRTPEGARFQWESKNLGVTQEFSFARATGAPATTGVRIDLILTNLGSSTVSVGVSDCLDTYLGESRRQHFRIQPGGEVAAESTIPGDRMITSWISEGKTGEGPALERVTSGQGITPPDSIVFANWKRLNQASWSYDTSIGRSFNLLPYSINDSAVCQYYQPKPIGPGESRRIVSILGAFSEAGYVAGATPVIPTQPVPAAQTPSSGAAGAQSSSLEGIRDTLQSLNDLLQRIDGSLSSGRPVDEEDVQLIQDALSGIKSRSEPYLQTQ